MSKSKNIRKTVDLGALQTLLLLSCPPDDNGVQSVPILAAKLGLVDQGLYAWIRRNRIPYRRAAELVELNKERLVLIDGEEQPLTIDHFTPYL